MYQRHIQIFLTMNSLVKVQSSTFLYLCGNFFNFIQGDFHFLCQVVAYIFTKKLISPSIRIRMNMLNNYLLETAYFRTHGSHQLPVLWSGSAGKVINRCGLNILSVKSKIQQGGR